MTKQEIKKIILENKEILKKYKVKSIALFGSYVRNEQRKRSDIDFLVEFDMSAFGKNFEGYFDTYMALLSFLQKIFNRKIDLLTTSMISPYIKPYVLKEISYLERT